MLDLLKLADNGVICLPHSLISFVTVCIVIRVERIIVIILGEKG